MRVFVEPARLLAGPLTLTGDEHHYVAYARRARVGDPLEVVDGAGRRAAAVIAAITDAHTVLEVTAPEAVVAAAPHVRVLVPLIKGDRMDSCLEKLVEVGADTIVVWPAERSVVRLVGDRRDARIARYQAAALAAARQSGRARIPTVSWADSLATALAALPPGVRLVLDPACEEPLRLDPATDVTVISGPEGGLSPAEHDALGVFVPVGLGPRVLRAETAPVIAVALIRAATRS